MKPIEAGCLAVIVKGINTGKEVTVIKYLGIYKNDHLWEIDKELSWII